MELSKFAFGLSDDVDAFDASASIRPSLSASSDLYPPGSPTLTVSAASPPRMPHLVRSASSAIIDIVAQTKRDLFALENEEQSFSASSPLFSTADSVIDEANDQSSAEAIGHMVHRQRLKELYLEILNVLSAVEVTARQCGAIQTMPAESTLPLTVRSQRNKLRNLIEAVTLEFSRVNRSDVSFAAVKKLDSRFAVADSVSRALIDLDSQLCHAAGKAELMDASAELERLEAEVTVRHQRRPSNVMNDMELTAPASRDKAASLSSINVTGFNIVELASKNEAKEAQKDELPVFLPHSYGTTTGGDADSNGMIMGRSDYGMYTHSIQSQTAARRVLQAASSEEYRRMCRWCAFVRAITSVTPLGAPLEFQFVPRGVYGPPRATERGTSERTMPANVSPFSDVPTTVLTEPTPERCAVQVTIERDMLLSVTPFTINQFTQLRNAPDILDSALESMGSTVKLGKRASSRRSSCVDPPSSPRPLLSAAARVAVSAARRGSMFLTTGEEDCGDDPVATLRRRSTSPQHSRRGSTDIVSTHPPIAAPAIELSFAAQISRIIQSNPATDSPGCPLSSVFLTQDGIVAEMQSWANAISTALEPFDDVVLNAKLHENVHFPVAIPARLGPFSAVGSGGWISTPKDDTHTDPNVELPYVTARAVVNALGAHIPHWSELEVGLRGAECYTYPWGNEAIIDVLTTEAVDVTATNYDVTAGPSCSMQTISGTVRRIVDPGVYNYAASPFGLRRVCQFGVEWARCDGDAHNAMDQRNPLGLLHVAKSRFSLGEGVVTHLTATPQNVLSSNHRAMGNAVLPVAATADGKLWRCGSFRVAMYMDNLQPQNTSAENGRLSPRAADSSAQVPAGEIEASVNLEDANYASCMPLRGSPKTQTNPHTRFVKQSDLDNAVSIDDSERKTQHSGNRDEALLAMSDRISRESRRCNFVFRVNEVLVTCTEDAMDDPPHHLQCHKHTCICFNPKRGIHKFCGGDTCVSIAATQQEEVDLDNYLSALSQNAVIRSMGLVLPVVKEAPPIDKLLTCLFASPSAVYGVFGAPELTKRSSCAVPQELLWPSLGFSLEVTPTVLNARVHGICLWSSTEVDTLTTLCFRAYTGILDDHCDPHLQFLFPTLAGGTGQRLSVAQLEDAWGDPGASSPVGCSWSRGMRDILPKRFASDRLHDIGFVSELIRIHGEAPAVAVDAFTRTNGSVLCLRISASW